jgi:hypothetical protein
MKRQTFIAIAILAVIFGTSLYVITSRIGQPAPAVSTAESDPTPPQSPKPKRGSIVNADGSRPSGKLLAADVPGGCAGNPGDLCQDAPVRDYWPSGSEASLNKEYAAPAGSALKEIGGALESTSGNTITLRTTTNRLVRITFPLDTIAFWNSQRAANNPQLQIGFGDILVVTYGEPEGQRSSEVGPKQIYRSTVAL